MDDKLTELIIKAQNGDKDAFREIYNLYIRRIFKFIYYLSRDFELSQDLTQNVFIKAWQSLPSFSLQRGTIQAFLFTIARNFVIDHQRRKKSLPLEVARELVWNDYLEEKIDLDGEKKIMHQALSRLEDSERQIIVLRYFEELTSAEIAKIFSSNEGAVRAKLHRALSKLRKIFYEQR